MFRSNGIPMLIAAGLAALTLGAGANAQNQDAPVARFVAETANLASGPDAVRIDILAWSADEDRSRLVDAWNLILPAGGRGGGAPARGGTGRGARGRAAGAGPDAPAAPAAQARGRGGPGGRGGCPLPRTARARAPRNPKSSSPDS